MPTRKRPVYLYLVLPEEGAEPPVSQIKLKESGPIEWDPNCGDPDMYADPPLSPRKLRDTGDLSV